jgi:anti-sigma factor RsiW
MTGSTKNPPRPEIEFDADLMAYVDGQLGPEAAAAVEARLAADPAARDTVSAWTAQNGWIRGAAEALDTGPASLKTAALERELARALQRQGWRARLLGPGLRRMAASVAIFAAGWGGHMAWVAATDPYPGYVAEGLGAHQVFAEDLLRPVEFGADATDMAVDWLSAKLERKLAHPALDPLGLQLVGTRLLGTREGPLAQFIYEDRDGHRMSLIVAPHPEGMRAAPLRYADGGAGTRVGYWRDSRLDYAVVADTSDQQIEAVAEEVVRLMEGAL